MLRVLTAMIGACVSASVGQILVRRGMLQVGELAGWSPRYLATYFWHALTNPYVVAGTVGSASSAGGQALRAARSSTRLTSGALQADPFRVACPLPLSRTAIALSERPSPRSCCARGTIRAYAVTAWSRFTPARFLAVFCPHLATPCSVDGHVECSGPRPTSRRATAL